jgi:hypothetical protein
MGIGFRIQAHAIPMYSLYSVLVHQEDTLPTASFRFHLTMDTLAFG